MCYLIRSINISSITIINNIKIYVVLMKGAKNVYFFYILLYFTTYKLNMLPISLRRLKIFKLILPYYSTY